MKAKISKLICLLRPYKSNIASNCRLKYVLALIKYP